MYVCVCWMDLRAFLRKCCTSTCNSVNVNKNRKSGMTNVFSAHQNATYTVEKNLFDLKEVELD